MNFFEVALIGIGLAIDAMCVSVSNGIACKNGKVKIALINAFIFAFFQAVMPIIGFLAGELFVGYIAKYSNILVFIILFILALKMLYDGIIKKDEDEDVCRVTFKLLLIQAIATSIDALAVGFGFSAMRLNIIYSCVIIGAVTFLLTFFTFLLGNKIKAFLNNKAEIFAGILLILVSLKVLFFK